MSYDPKCYDLAKSFLADGGWTHSEDITALAQQIQDCIEDYLADMDKGGDAA